MAEKGPSQTPSEENPPVARGKHQFNQIYMPRYSLITRESNRSVFWSKSLKKM